MRVDDPSDSPDIDMVTMKQLIEEARNGNVHQVLAGHPELVRKFFAGFWQELVKAQVVDRERKTQRKLGGTASGPNVFQLPES